MLEVRMMLHLSLSRILMFVAYSSIPTAKPHQTMDLGTPLIGSSSVHMPKGAILFRNEAKSSKRGNAGMSESSHHHHAFDTPDLTPIPVNHSFLPHLTTTGGAGPGGLGSSNNRVSQYHLNHDSSLLFSDFVNPSVVRRARQVASQLYYEPSPEASIATPSPLLRTTAPTRHYLRGLDKPPTSNRLSFSSVIPDHSTPVPAADATVRRSGHRAVQFLKESTVASSSIHHHDGSTHARKPRALFPSSENRNANTEPEAMDQDDQNNTNDLDGKESRRTDVNNESLVNNKGVPQILQLFSLLGAAHWRLCQVRETF